MSICSPVPHLPRPQAHPNNLSGNTRDPDLGDYLGYPLFGSLTLLPYLGADGLTKGMSPDDRWWFHVLFSCFWGMVAFGALCKHSQYRVLIWYAWLADRIGMLAITALVVFYSCFIIAPEATRTVKFILGAAAAIHIGSSILVKCYKLLVFTPTLYLFWSLGN
uniref:Uncharacterized protein n=1 Tax=Aegilops tauschii subsp. strangulata TaxID=200361 RepID=A0A453G4Y3_AEGTS